MGRGRFDPEERKARVRARIEKSGNLPTLPEVVVKIVEMGDDEQTTARQLGAEIAGYDKQLLRLTQRVCPELLARPGVGFEVASSLLVAAGDNPDRLHSEASFAALCGVSPLDASSGQQRRHRLNRGGNRDANRALWVVAMTRLRVDERTQAYAARRTKQGRTKREILRCLKRYIARELYSILRCNTLARPLDVT